MTTPTRFAIKSKILASKGSAFVDTAGNPKLFDDLALKSDVTSSIDQIAARLAIHQEVSEMIGDSVTTGVPLYVNHGDVTPSTNCDTLLTAANFATRKFNHISPTIGVEGTAIDDTFIFGINFTDVAGSSVSNGIYTLENHTTYYQFVRWANSADSGENWTDGKTVRAGYYTFSNTSKTAWVLKEDSAKSAATRDVMTIGTTDRINFAKFNHVDAYEGGAGIAISGQTISLNVTDSSGNWLHWTGSGYERKPIAATDVVGAWIPKTISVATGGTHDYNTTDSVLYDAVFMNGSSVLQLPTLSGVAYKKLTVVFNGAGGVYMTDYVTTENNNAVPKQRTVKLYDDAVKTTTLLTFTYSPKTQPSGEEAEGTPTLIESGNFIVSTTTSNGANVIRSIPDSGSNALVNYVSGSLGQSAELIWDGSVWHVTGTGFNIE